MIGNLLLCCGLLLGTAYVANWLITLPEGPGFLLDLLGMIVHRFGVSTEGINRAFNCLLGCES